MKNALIVDDHPSVRLALRYTLEKQGLDRIDECDNGVEAISLIKKNGYHIVILDIGIPAMDGMSVISAVRKAENNTRILVFTSQAQDVYISRCMEAGASGFVSKNDDMDNVVIAIKAVISGYNFFPHIPVGTKDTESRFSRLTNRELDVLRKLASGMTNNEIAANMCLSNKTISTYKTRVMGKLGVSTLVDLITIAQKEHLP
ncbi:TPA: response regulator [Citrobacter gillenii]